MATTKVAIVGTGLLARQLLKRCFKSNAVEVVLVCASAYDFPDIDTFGTQLVYNLRYDTIYGRENDLQIMNYYAGDNEITINGKSIKLDLQANVADFPFGSYSVDVAIDCSGKADDGTFYNGSYQAGAKTSLTTTRPTTNGWSYYNYACVFPLNDGAHGVSAYMPSGSVIVQSIVNKIFNDQYGITECKHTVLISSTNFNYVQDYPDGTASYAGRSCDNIALQGMTTNSMVGWIIPELRGKEHANVYRINTKQNNAIDFFFDIQVSQSQASDILDDVFGIIKRDFSEFGEVLFDDVVSSDFTGEDKFGLISKSFYLFNNTYCGCTAMYDNIILQTNNIVAYLEKHESDWSH